MTFFSLLSTAASSIFYGIMVTAVIMAILYTMLRSLSRGIVQTPVFYITGVILAILLVVQFSMMIGAMQAKSAVDEAEAYLTQLVEEKQAIVSTESGQQTIEAIKEQFPIIGNYIDSAGLSDLEISELPEAMHEEMAGYLSSFIWHRVWWIVGFIVAACIAVVIFQRGGSRSNMVSFDGSYSDGGNLQF